MERRELQGTLVTSVSRGNVVAGRLLRSQLGSSADTAGGTACVNNHVDYRGTGTDGSSHPAAERTSTTASDGGDDTHVRKRKLRTASAELDRHARTARADRSGRHTGDRQARPVRRRSDEVRGLVVQTEIVPRSRGSAVPARVDDDRNIVDTETQRNPRQRSRSRVGQVSQGRRERRVRGQEWEPKLRTRYVTHDECVGVPIPRRYSKQAGCVRENRTRLREPIRKDRRRRYQDRSDDAGDGGHASERALHPEQRQDHKLESDAREILEITRTQQCIDSQPTPMQLGANPKSEGKGKDSKGKGKGTDVKSKGKGKDAKNESP